MVDGLDHYLSALHNIYIYIIYNYIIMTDFTVV